MWPLLGLQRTSLAAWVKTTRPRAVQNAPGGVRVAFHGDTSLSSLAQKASTRCLEIAYGQPL